MSSTEHATRETNAAENAAVLHTQYRKPLTSNATARDAFALAVLVLAWSGAIWFLSGH